MKTKAEKNIEFINLLIRETKNIKDKENVKMLKSLKRMLIKYALSSEDFRAKGDSDEN